MAQRVGQPEPGALDDAFATVAEMAAAVKAGTTPALLSTFLATEFPPPSGRWERWLEGRRTHQVREIDLYREADFFRRSCVFQMRIEDSVLERHPLPSSNSYGLFALGPSGLRYLNRRPEQVSLLFRDEARSLDEADPTALARLLAETLASEGNNTHDVVCSREEVTNYDGGLRGFGGDYILDPAEWQTVEDHVWPPTLDRDADHAWRLTFCALSGWMHAKSSFTRHRFLIHPDFTIAHRQDILSSAIFSSVPMLRY